MSTRRSSELKDLCCIRKLTIEKQGWASRTVMIIEQCFSSRINLKSTHKSLFFLHIITFQLTAVLQQWYSLMFPIFYTSFVALCVTGQMSKKICTVTFIKISQQLFGLFCALCIRRHHFLWHHTHRYTGDALGANTVNMITAESTGASLGSRRLDSPNGLCGGNAYGLSNGVWITCLSRCTLLW